MTLTLTLTTLTLTLAPSPNQVDVGPQSEAVLIPPGGPVPMGSAEVPRSPLYLAYISLHLAYISPISLPRRPGTHGHV